MQIVDRLKIIELYIKAYNTFDVDGMLALLHEQIEFRNISKGRINAIASGKEEFRQLAEESKSIFSTRQQRPKYFAANGDMISVKVQFIGIIAMNTPDGLTAGQEINLEGTSFFTFQDSLLIRITDIS